MTWSTSRGYELNQIDPMTESDFVWRFFNRSVPGNFRILRPHSKRREFNGG